MIIQSLFNALSGLRTSARSLQTSANNVANLQTPGFKKGEAQITDAAAGGARVAAVTRSTAPGPLIPSSNAFDLAVNGRGYFQVSLADGGTGFTRAGNFKLDGSGRLVTPGGDPVAPAITLPAGTTEVAVDASGQVSALVGGTSVPVGRIELADFNNPGALTGRGGNLFLESAASGSPVTGFPGTGGFGLVTGGALEGSNVDLAEEAIHQIVAKTAFKANANVIRAADDMLGTLLDIQS